MSEILQVKKAVSRIDDITSVQFHTYTPYTTSFNNNDEIRITIQSQDLYVQPSESYLYIEFSAVGLNGEAISERAFFTHALTTHMFSEMRYELNGFEIDRCKSPGITSLLKTMVSCKSFDKGAFGLLTCNSNARVMATTYCMLLPLRFVFGFCDDYNKIVLNSKHELILVRSRSNVGLYRSNTDHVQFTINKIQWKIPHVMLNDQAKLSMLKTVERREEIPLSFRSWDLYELPRVPETTRSSWNVKTTTQLTKPRYVIVAFQTNRNQIVEDPAMFDNCNVSDIKLYLNNERYPYDDLNLHFGQNDYHELFNMWSKVQQTYYNGTSNYNPADISVTNFGATPIFVFDCSRSDESVKNSMVDVRIEMEARENFPANTTAYCLIIHDNLIRYSPSTSIVTRDI